MKIFDRQRSSKWLFASVFFLAVSTFSCYRIPKQAPPNHPKHEIFFVPVPITKLSSTQAPCIDVRIGNTTLSMELDLGFRGDLTLTGQSADAIGSKTFIFTKSMYGMLGKEYLTNIYRIPKASIGAMAFIQPTLQNDRDEFIADSVFVQGGGKPSPRPPGRVGWELFYNVNLLVDLKNSQIAFCDSVDTLQKQGYPTEHFVKTPLLLERGLVEFEASTGEGSLHCTLDTGATWNMLNTEIAEGRSIEQIAWDPENVLHYPSLKIGAEEFGPIDFHRIPIHLPIRIEATLGMEFFQDHLVFLDFSRGYAYFFKNTSPVQRNSCLGSAED
ncbi:MAG: hypothetical protein HY861_02390 [Chlamydiia bacterium]|nr:hypothetical protein [Chlamydiia bacterium]